MRLDENTPPNQQDLADVRNVIGPVPRSANDNYKLQQRLVPPLEDFDEWTACQQHGGWPLVVVEKLNLIQAQEAAEAATCK